MAMYYQENTDADTNAAARLQALGNAASIAGTNALTSGIAGGIKSFSEWSDRANKERLVNEKKKLEIDKAKRLAQITNDARFKRDQDRLNQQEQASLAYSKEVDALQKKPAFDMQKPEIQQAQIENIKNRYFGKDKINGVSDEVKAMSLVPEDNMYSKAANIQNAMAMATRADGTSMWTDDEVTKRIAGINAQNKNREKQTIYANKIDMDANQGLIANTVAEIKSGIGSQGVNDPQAYITGKISEIQKMNVSQQVKDAIISGVTGQGLQYIQGSAVQKKYKSGIDYDANKEARANYIKQINFAKIKEQNNLYSEKNKLQTSLDAMTDLTDKGRAEAQTMLDNKFKIGLDRVKSTFQTKKDKLVYENAKFTSDENKLKVKDRKKQEQIGKDVQVKLGQASNKFVVPMSQDEIDKKVTELDNKFMDTVDKRNKIAEIERIIKEEKLEPKAKKTRTDQLAKLQTQLKEINIKKSKEENKLRAKIDNPTVKEMTDVEKFQRDMQIVYQSGLNDAGIAKKMKIVANKYTLPKGMASAVTSGKMSDLDKWAIKQEAATAAYLKIPGTKKEDLYYTVKIRGSDGKMVDKNIFLGEKEISRKITNLDKIATEKRAKGFDTGKGITLYLNDKQTKDDIKNGKKGKELSPEKQDVNIQKFMRKLKLPKKHPWFSFDDNKYSDDLFSNDTMKVIAEKRITTSDINNKIAQARVDIGKDVDWKVIVKDYLFPLIYGKETNIFDWGEYN